MINKKLLKTIVASKHKECSDLRALGKSLRIRAEQNTQKTRSFTAALRRKIDSGKAAIICESKRSSPSAGMLNEALESAEFAKKVECAGATCLSVLTDARWFGAHKNDLAQAQKASSIPILRKDFIVDTLQVYESRLLGADCILLIMRLLEDAQAKEIEDCALTLGLDVLVEVHEHEELERAIKNLRTNLIGVNSRDLQSLNIDMPHAVEILRHIPIDKIAVAESGLRKPHDLQPFIKVRKSESGPCNLAFLIGEAIVRSADVHKAIKDFCSVIEAKAEL